MPRSPGGVCLFFEQISQFCLLSRRLELPFVGLTTAVYLFDHQLQTTCDAVFMRPQLITHLAAADGVCTSQKKQNYPPFRGNDVAKTGRKLPCADKDTLPCQESIREIRTFNVQLKG